MHRSPAAHSIMVDHVGMSTKCSVINAALKCKVFVVMVLYGPRGTCGTLSTARACCTCAIDVLDGIPTFRTHVSGKTTKISGSQTVTQNVWCKLHQMRGKEMRLLPFFRTFFLHLYVENPLLCPEKRWDTNVRTSSTKILELRHVGLLCSWSLLFSNCCL